MTVISQSILLSIGHDLVYCQNG